MDLRSIRALTLAYAEFGPDGVAALAEVRLGGLRRLDLRFCRLGDPGVVALAAILAVADVEDLRLQGNHIGPEGVEALATAARGRRVAVLDLRGNPITARGAEALARSAWSKLDVLHVHLDDVGERGARALAASPHLPSHVRRLWSARCPA